MYAWYLLMVARILSKALQPQELLFVFGEYVGEQMGRKLGYTSLVLVGLAKLVGEQGLDIVAVVAASIDTPTVAPVLVARFCEQQHTKLVD